MSKHNARRQAIQQLVSTQEIRTQDELVRQLKNRNYSVTQATISRDIGDLGLIKVGGFYRLPGEAPAPAHLERTLRDKILRVAPAGPHLVVLHTNPGEAGSVGLSLDRLTWTGIVGTIAGDDTVFIACHSVKSGQQIIKRLQALLGDET